MGCSTLKLLLVPFAIDNKSAEVSTGTKGCASSNLHVLQEGESSLGEPLMSSVEPAMCELLGA